MVANPKGPMRIIIQDVKHYKLKQDLLWVGTATLVTVIIWVAYSIYLAFNKTTVDPEVNRLLQPLNPSLDQQTLMSLDDRFTPPDQFTPVGVVTKTYSSNQELVSDLTSPGSTSGANPTGQAPTLTPAPTLPPNANQ
jgi:hypothetical protein